MTQEVATQNSSNFEAVAPMAPVAPNVLENLRMQAESWGAAAHIAEQLARTDFAGPFKGKPADMAAAILKGATLGIPPESIGKSIYVVHGTPALYGKTALAIALQHGYIVETLEDTAQAVTVRMTSPKGQEMEVRYTIERATQEGLVKGNKAQYESRPSKMLYWKCIGELTDRMIPHLTGGMPIKEDWEQSPVKMTSTRLAPKARGLSAIAAATQPGIPSEPVGEEPVSEEDAEFVESVKAELAKCASVEEVESFMAELKQDPSVPEAALVAGRDRWKEVTEAGEQ
ncbi:hypothetical protein ACWIB8_05255 [Corynebacterium flavescens]